ncbi:2-succinyl-5-enolpyruvyl-6-hydroxy-3-cyclohexene-1-carboxylic-acid synthase [Microvenator marinus]|uniref:2-succinyl-5-enolpyruvyl-6-hydroxy-3-cyclohexene-1-carboxylate synthase n=1 Tax=Microvenator marinus TaxID=2600177 RepID=A0A5B8XWI5_9DELT|nr:2-succinyl-5-enolpyruvyl-6-hydroxy-3-cyclohexene-1-carboxylic-acid synthase [Microvenator marinus]QED28096.1 2-succinyl-5-enolpyruvyl-6-hydroxy-3-cyclohexene-1-carboxylic-acid synthase [Microvenator marinus]
MNFLANINVLWGHILIDELARAGVREVVVSPGSRSTPLTLAANAHPDIRAINVIDERSAGFLALGLAMATERPVVLICTSGSAVSNYHPAISEARQSRVGLIVLSADRPEWLREAGAPQAMRQDQLFGPHTVWFHELAQPEADRLKLRYVRSTADKAVAMSERGPVHLNVSFRKPLEATEVPRDAPDGVRDLELGTPEVAGRADRQPWVRVLGSAQSDSAPVLRALANAERPLVTVGADWKARRWRPFVAWLKQLGYAVWAEAQSGVVGNVARLDASVQPDLVVHLGRAPIDWPAQRWMNSLECELIFVGPDDSHGLENPEHLASTWLRLRGLRPRRKDLEIIQNFQPQEEFSKNPKPKALESNKDTKEIPQFPHPNEQQRKIWISNETNHLTQTEGVPTFFDGAIHSALHALDPSTAIFVSSSMPFRDFENFGPKGRDVFVNRGLNGIDGVLSSAFGVAAARVPDGSRPGVVAVVGDVAFSHDASALLTARRAGISAIVVVINNGGGRIFEFLPVKGQAGFQEHFNTEPSIDLQALALAYGAGYARVTAQKPLENELQKRQDQPGIHLIEAVVDWESSIATRRSILEARAGLSSVRVATPVHAGSVRVAPWAITALHGFSGTRADWRVIEPYLGPIEALNLPGHEGKSGVETWDQAIEDLAQELRSQDRPVLIGYSMGGRLALGLASTYPELISGLVTIGARAGLPESERGARAQEDEARATAVERDLHGFMREWARLPLLNLRPAHPARAPGRVAHSGEGLASALRALGPARQPLYDVKLKVPALFVAGELDKVYCEAAREMAETLGAKAAVVANAGHAAHLDEPEATAAIISEFLEQL